MLGAPTKEIARQTEIGVHDLVGVGLRGRGYRAHVDHHLHFAPALLQPVPHLLGGHEIADGVFGEVSPLARVGPAKTVADHQVERPVLGQFGDDIGADEPGSAGDEDNAAGHGFSENRRMVAVVE